MHCSSLYSTAPKSDTVESQRQEKRTNQDEPGRMTEGMWVTVDGARSLVGVYNFSAWSQGGRWWRTEASAPDHADEDWRSRFPERQPLQGWYDDSQEAMDVQIAQAQAYGIDFFVLLWYPPADPKVDEAWSTSGLNAAVDRFMSSSLAGKVRFAISYVNHPPLGFINSGQWMQACRRFAEWFRHPAYLRLDGTPLFLVHSAADFRRQWGGAEGARARLASMQEFAVNCGSPGVLVGGGLVGGGPIALDQWGELSRDGYGFMTGYNCNMVESKRDTYERREVPYAQAVQRHLELWQTGRERCAVPFMPFVTVNWDPRPWMGSECMYWVGKDKASFTGFLLQASRAVGTEERHRLGQVGMVFVYAWNELGEGGIVVPTRGTGYAEVEAIRDAFAATVAQHEGVGPGNL